MDKVVIFIFCIVIIVLILLGIAWFLGKNQCEKEYSGIWITKDGSNICVDKELNRIPIPYSN